MSDMQASLGVVVRDEKAVVSSRDVARIFEKTHGIVTRSIRDLISKCSPEFGQLNFALTTFNDSQNREQEEFLLSKDGFVLLAMGYTGEKAMKFKEAYIAEFNRMEDILRRGDLDARAWRKLAVHDRNSRARSAALLINTLRLLGDALSAPSKQVVASEMTVLLCGKRLIELPPVKKSFTATEIAAEAGVSAWKVGHLANLHDIKTEEYGMSILSKSPHSDRQVVAFIYNEEGRRKLLEILASEECA